MTFPLGLSKVKGLQSQAIQQRHFVNSLPNDKILDVTKLKAFADDKINVDKMMISVFHRVENIVEKGVNAGYQHFLLFPQCFKRLLSCGP